MPVPDIEACQTFVFANRLIAERFKQKSEQALEAAQQIEDINARMRLADISHDADQRAVFHDSLANLQERDMGIRCHCPSRARATLVPPHQIQL